MSITLLGVTLGPAHRPQLSLALGAHLAPLLGPLFGVRTTETTEALFAQMQDIQARAGRGTLPDQLADHFELERLKLALLRRDGLQEGALDRLVQARVERAFESILTHQVVEALPAALAAPFQALGVVMAEQLRRLTPSQNEQVIEAMVEDLEREHPRPWGNNAPLLARLCQSKEVHSVRRDAITAFLAGRMESGHDILAALIIIRSLFLGLKAAGLDSSKAPWLKAADRDYMAHIMHHKGRSPPKPGATLPRDAVVGITALSAPSPVDSPDLQPGVRAATVAQPNFKLPAVEDAIRSANPFASGISGTTNMFLHAASFFNAKGKTTIDGPAITTALAALLCYDGGHSVHEVFMVANLLRDLPGLNLKMFAGYAPGHARGLFVDLASSLGFPALAEDSFAKLLEHFDVEG